MLGRLNRYQRSPAGGLAEVARFPDPVGKLLDDAPEARTGLIARFSTPSASWHHLRSRPNVTAGRGEPVFIFPGNATHPARRQGSLNSQPIIARTMSEAGRICAQRFPTRPFMLCPRRPRSDSDSCCRSHSTDLCMPRGCESLSALRRLLESPPHQHYRGVCHSSWMRAI